MLKKVILATLFIGFIGVLVGGAIVRTLDKPERVAAANSRVAAGAVQLAEPQNVANQSNAAAEPAVAAATTSKETGLPAPAITIDGQPGAVDDTDFLNPDSRGNGTTAGNPDSNGNRGGTEGGVGAGTGIPQAQVDTWLTLSGEVTSLDTYALALTLEDGSLFTLQGRAWRFAQESGFWPGLGDMIMLTGFYEAGVLQIGQIQNQASGQQVMVRDESGRPLWAGNNGRRG